MEFNEYQRLASISMLPECRNLSYLGLGLAGETGEVCDKLKRLIRGDGIIDDTLLYEISDCLWYLSQIADILKVPFDQIGEMNIKKLADRMAKNTIKGKGDKR